MLPMQSRSLQVFLSCYSLPEFRFSFLWKWLYSELLTLPTPMYLQVCSYCQKFLFSSCFFIFAKSDSIKYLMVWPVFCHFLINCTETNCVIKGWNMVPKPNLSLCLIWKEAELFTITCILVLKPTERAFISYFLPFRHLQDKRGPGSTGIISSYFPRTAHIEWIPRKKQKKRMGFSLEN